jgi:hypothetical protein
MNHTKTKDISYIFIVLDRTKYVVYILYIQYILILQVYISARGIVVHYTQDESASPINFQEIHFFKWEYCVKFVTFSGM